ncbi:hypothetical protein ACMD2_07373 [Ananas comosus]|uniref:Uncharacterized protein ycf33 n=1 Tax=Ananas comosus TaxID=4615 RepID=A0A199VJ30_ANACO|nr:hypothetical protein ACMD2_07373 [Ananas comosus]
MKLYASQLNPPPPLHFPKNPKPTKSHHFTPPQLPPKPPKFKLAPKNTTVPSHLLLEAPPKWVLLGGASLSFGLLLLLFGPQQAWAFGPDGPLLEEFWDNMRRYALYTLTVSTGALYTVFQPIVELLKNPITAILILLIVVGSGFLVSQVGMPRKEK